MTGIPIAWDTPFPDTITVTPASATVEEGDSTRFVCIGHYDDASPDVDVSSAAYWHADEIDAVAHAAGNGVVFGLKPGGPTTVTVVLTPWIVVGEPEPIPPREELFETVEVTVTAASPVPPPEGRFLLAFDQTTLEPSPVWTRIDEVYPNLVTSYTIDRGRQYELDRFDTGRATVEIADPDGILNPLNPDGPFYGEPGPYGPLIKPLMQATLGRRNPVSGEWKTRYRGFVDALDYAFDPSQQLNRLTVSLVDLFEMLSTAEMQPGQFGVTPPAGSEGQVYFPEQHVEDRIAAATYTAGVSPRFQVIFPGNVLLHDTVYSPGESPLTVVQEAADGEFPGANVFCDRQGRLVFHDRFARFYPADVAAAAGEAKWDYHEWKVGDGAAVQASTPDTVQLREFAFDRGLSRLINSATATPAGIDDADVPGQLIAEPESISYFGIRSWSATGLLTKQSLLDGSSGLAETRQFAWYFVANFKWLRDRITTIGFRPLDPDDPRAPALWEFLNSVDIGDLVDITVASPGGGGYTNYQHFVEGVHEQVRPLTPDFDDVTLRLDLSPMADYETNPWPAPDGFTFTGGARPRTSG